MGRGRGKGKKQSVIAEDPGSEKDEENVKGNGSNNDLKTQAITVNKRKRKRSTQVKEKIDPKKEENGVLAKSGPDDSMKSTGFRQNGSRRKNKPRRAAEAGVDCNPWNCWNFVDTRQGWFGCVRLVVVACYCFCNFHMLFLILILRIHSRLCSFNLKLLLKEKLKFCRYSFIMSWYKGIFPFSQENFCSYISLLSKHVCDVK
uniref:Uncharacterized protein n=1 Tax=Cajanus cajan TaxID=3821 RepID=A0A151TU62_CAJCA|nr:hypothetical protein KK1_009813 [Cajanus cajan]